ncbi:MAG: TauD/TfdA family dioxygenase, partial [Rhodospirillaceae bacterium]|nr:TauD/TfdA family dioxygenase [Rhodospirillaceae bacterium]
MTESFEVKPLGTALGAEIIGLDLAQPFGDNTAQALLGALGENGVIVFRDQLLTPEQHRAVAQALGRININRFFPTVEGHPDIAEVRKEPGQTSNIGSEWHTDHSYDTEPALGSLLYARDVPPTGGDTIFASMYAAYESLSDGLKAALATLRAVHSSAHVFGEAALSSDELKGVFANADSANQFSTHPMVIHHPTSGRSALYVNP